MKFPTVPVSRRYLVLIGLALIVLLDVGRSTIFRTELAEPASIWRPKPEIYSETVWPPASAAQTPETWT